MAAEDPQIFRKAALARLASPERLDARVAVTAYRPALLAGLAALLVLVAMFAAWLLTAR
jgi:hypothetical protein